MDRVALREKATAWIGKYKYLVLVLLIGVVLMLIPVGKTKEDHPVAQTETTAPQQTLSQELADILSKIDGAGKVQIMLTVKSGEQTVFQTDSNAQDRYDTVVITDADRNQTGLVQQIVPPTYRGAIVLCQGAESPAVRLAITEAVSKVTGLDSSQISVLKMK